MMKLRKCTSFLLAVVMLVSLCVTADAQEPAAGEMDGCVVVMHTNDVHGAIDGYAKVAALKKSYEARGAYVLLMDAGDFAQGDPAVSESEGAAAVELMNLTGYDWPYRATMSSITAITVCARWRKRRNSPWQRPMSAIRGRLPSQRMKSSPRPVEPRSGCSA